MAMWRQKCRGSCISPHDFFAERRTQDGGGYSLREKLHSGWQLTVYVAGDSGTDITSYRCRDYSWNVAQLGSALDLGSRGCGFKSRHSN